MICTPKVRQSFGWHVSKTRSYEITTPKNRASYRQILMPNNLYDMIYEHYVQVKQDYVFSNNIFVLGGQVPVSDQTLRRNSTLMLKKLA